jgi:hypothetical protein
VANHKALILVEVLVNAIFVAVAALHTVRVQIRETLNLAVVLEQCLITIRRLVVQAVVLFLAALVVVVAVGVRAVLAQLLAVLAELADIPLAAAGLREIIL